MPARKVMLRPVLTALLLAPLAALHGAEYHVSSAGDDANPGTTPTKAWKTVERVNRQAFQPGDSILFQSGGVWQGQLRPQGSGTEGKPIRLDRYGEGPLPVIDMGTNSGAVVALKNQDWWEIGNLALKGQRGGPLANRQGISIEGHDAGRVLRHLWIRNCQIRDIWGTMDYPSSGIWIAVPRWVSPWGNRVSFDDVLVEGNDIRGTDRCGVVVWTPSGEVFAPAVRDQNLPFKWEDLLPAKRVVVRGNTLEDIGGDAVLVLGATEPLIERNTARRTCLRSGVTENPKDNPHSAAIWLHSCTRGVMQFNAVYETGKQPHNNDGMSYDFDYNCRECVLQYNYSQDNQGGFLLIMNGAYKNVVRYNLSQNDRSHVMFLLGSVSEGNLVHNNVFYNDAAAAEIYGKATYHNNIFHASGKGRFVLIQPEATAFRRNCFFGPWDRLPDDPEAIKQDPCMKSPGLAKGPDSAAGYQLQPTSPCRSAGVLVSNNGGRDFWGNPLRSEKPDIGAHESQAPEKRTP